MKHRWVAMACTAALALGIASAGLARSAFLVKEGMRGDNVRQVQELLIAKGLLDGRADGICGRGTVEAIKRFQQQQGLTADGICGDETYARLRGDGANGGGTGALKPGMRGDRVRELQELLGRHGYLGGAADGVYGPGTEQAVRNFQQAAGLEVDGICGSATLAKLKAAGAAGAGSTGALKPGMRGDRVRDMQELLYKHGYLMAKPDGIYGQRTEEAVRSFQQDTGLVADGICGERTMARLEDRPADGQGTFSRENSPYASPGSVIKPGMHGDGVILLQEYLIDLGYLSDAADGLCGPKTVAALKSFQRDSGLAADGICGRSTYAALQVSPSVLEPAPAPSHSGTPSGRAMQVDATAYSPMEPGMSLYTATGKFLRHGIIAVDPSVIPLGTRVFIPGYGEASAEDTGGAIRGNRIDLAFDTVEECSQFGRRTITIYILD